MKYYIDKQHSDIEFKIKHLMISSVRGRFCSFEAGMSSYKKDFSDAQIWCHIKVDSIDTAVSDRDAHLKSQDFFDVEKYPLMKFHSTEIRQKGSNEYVLEGLMEIKGVEKPVCLDLTYNGSDFDNTGREKFGFEIEGKIKRSDWNLDFNMPGGKSTLLIGEEVILDISIQMVRDEE